MRIFHRPLISRGGQSEFACHACYRHGYHYSGQRKTYAQAERLAEAHRSVDGLRVQIVRADQIYNEFSSGTPDATAYRRFMKMLYDRAATDADMPRYLLLFGDGMWDNRMITADTRGLNPDDYLLCYESENSLSHTSSFVMEDYFGAFG